VEAFSGGGTELRAFLLWRFGAAFLLIPSLRRFVRRGFYGLKIAHPIYHSVQISSNRTFNPKTSSGIPPCSWLDPSAAVAGLQLLSIGLVPSYSRPPSYNPSSFRAENGRDNSPSKVSIMFMRPPQQGHGGGA